MGDRLMEGRLFIAVVDVEDFDDTELGAAVRDAHAHGVHMVMLAESRVPMARLRPGEGAQRV